MLIPLTALLILAGPERARVPADVPLAGIMELARQGEIALLPQHNKQPFNALVLTRSSGSCDADAVAHAMMDVGSWHKRWNIKEAVIVERTPATGEPTSVLYELQLNMMLAPRIPGLIQRPKPDTVVFNDVETGAQFIWTLEDVDGGCSMRYSSMRYSLLETPGKASGWVAAVKTLEASAVDAANFAAALSSARGFARSEAAANLGAGGEGAFAALAAHGTAFRVVHTKQSAAGKALPRIVARRVIDRPINDVLWSLRDKKRWPDKIDVLSSVTDKGTAAEYTVAAFGGRVSFETAVVEKGDANTADGLTLTETITDGDGDLSKGSWFWRVRPAPGGTDVELTWDLDLTAGSAIMRTLAKTDPVARESLAIHMVLSFMGDVVSGRPVGKRALAKVP
jgi:hypothetical protein